MNQKLFSFTHFSNATLKISKTIKIGSIECQNASKNDWNFGYFGYLVGYLCYFLSLVSPVDVKLVNVKCDLLSKVSIILQNILKSSKSIIYLPLKGWFPSLVSNLFLCLCQRWLLMYINLTFKFNKIEFLHLGYLGRRPLNDLLIINSMHY